MDVLIEYSDLLIGGLKVTIYLLIISLIFGFIFAIMVALARLSKYKLIALPASLFTSVIRGTPLLVQIYIYYYGLGTVFAHLPGIRSSLFGLI